VQFRFIKGILHILQEFLNNVVDYLPFFFLLPNTYKKYTSIKKHGGLLKLENQAHQENVANKNA
jgi:glycopeptide antibiotics resistance protein